MALSKDEVIKMVTGFLVVVRQKHDVKQAYLFGSFAKGVTQEHSDIDLAIILGNLDVNQAPPFDEYFRIFHEAQEYNSLLEVVCFLEEEFDKDGGALVKHIKKEGIRLV